MPGPFGNPTFTITMTGLPEAKGAVARRAAPSLTKTLRDANKAAGGVLKPVIKGYAPVRLGELARSTRLSSSSDGKVVVGPKAPHRHFVIKGTKRGVEPNPYVDRAAQASGPVMRLAWVQKLQSDVSR
jgi:hypothetical protein